MEREHLRAVVRRFVDCVMNGADPGAADELLVPGHALHDPLAPDPLPGPDGVRAWTAGMRAAFPDLVYRVDGIVVDDGEAAVRLMGGGTHRDVLLEGAASGQTFMARAVCWFRFEGDRIAETWVVPDTLTAALQLGVVRRTSSWGGT